MPLEATVTVPCDGVLFAVTVSDVPRSFVSTDAPFNATPAAVVPTLFTATGVTVRLTVAVDVCPLASVAV